MQTPQATQYCSFEGRTYSEGSEICTLLRCMICKKGAPQQPTANDRPHPGFAPHLKSHITAPFSLVLFVWIARLNLLDVLDVIWELKALIGAGEGRGIERVRFGSDPCFTRSFYGVPV